MMNRYCFGAVLPFALAQLMMTSRVVMPSGFVWVRKLRENLMQSSWELSQPRLIHSIYRSRDLPGIFTIIVLAYGLALLSAGKVMINIFC